MEMPKEQKHRRREREREREWREWVGMECVSLLAWFSLSLRIEQCVLLHNIELHNGMAMALNSEGNARIGFTDSKLGKTLTFTHRLNRLFSLVERETGYL
jgi:hypothetical protein